MAESTRPDGPPAGNRGMMIVLSYLWILAVVPLLVERSDREVQWHARNGVVLMVAELLFWLVFNIVFGVTMGLGCAGFLLGPVIGLLFIAVHVAAIVLGLRGDRLVVPSLSGFADRF